MEKQKYKKRRWIAQKVFNVADGVAKLPDKNRVQIELLVYAYMFFLSLFLAIGFIIAQQYVRASLFTLMTCASILTFISKSVMYRKLKFLEQFK